MDISVICSDIEMRSLIFIVKPEKPTLTKPPDVAIMEQETAVFETLVTGLPEPTVEWFIGAMKLEPSEKVEIEQDDQAHRLVLKQCEVYQTGSITVKAHNEAGYVKSLARLTVKGRVSLLPHKTHTFNIHMYTYMCM